MLLGHGFVRKNGLHGVNFPEIRPQSCTSCIKNQSTMGPTIDVKELFLNIEKIEGN